MLLAGAGVWCDCTEEGMEIEGGNYILTKGLNLGSTLIYQCPPNLFPYPAQTRHCGYNRWQALPSRERNIRQECRCKNILTLYIYSIYIFHIHVYIFHIFHIHVYFHSVASLRLRRNFYPELFTVNSEPGRG